MTENKNLNHTFSSYVNMPLYLYVSRVCIRLKTVSLIEGFFFLFFFVGGGGGLWSYVHHTVDMKILFLTLSVRLVVFLFFNVHAIFDDSVKVIWSQLQEIDVIAH